MIWPQQRLDVRGAQSSRHREEPAGRRSVLSRSSRRVATTPIGLRCALAVFSVFSLFTICLTVFAATESAAQVLLLPENLGPPNYRVSSIKLRYASDHPDQPPLDALLPVEVRLREADFGWAAPRSDDPGVLMRVGGPDSETIRLEASGLARVLAGIVAGLVDGGLYGVDVRPAPTDIDVQTERDLRPADHTTLEVIVRVGRIKQIRTIAAGGRITSDWKIDNELHNHIRRRSPLQPTGSATADSTDLVDRRELEDYLYRLNRHSGRRVEAALSPAEEPGEVVLDYRVLEAKPWYIYGQGSNTGTYRTTNWQARIGAAHRQLTGRDDVLSVEYLNAGLNGVHSVRAQYQAPFFGPERPDWMNRRQGDPALIDWIPRDKIPWWGVDRLRWEVDFNWSKSRASRDSSLIGFGETIISTQFQYGGRFIYEVFQYRDFFVDLWAGVRARDIGVRNGANGDFNQGGLFIVPNAGIHAERINQLSTLNLNASVRGSNSDISASNLDGLGRDETDDRYAIIDFNLGYSAFLEPLLNPNRWRDPSTELSSTLAHELALGVRGQYAFDYRLIPQASYPIGGLHSVRGYDQSSAVGDTVIIGSVEYRFHIPRSLPVMREPLQIPLLGDFRATPQQVYGRPDWDLTLRVFVDVGRSIRNDRSSAAAGIAEFDQTLIGAGVGAELQLRSNFTARLDWATALKDTHGVIANPTKAGDQQLHVLFSILY